MTSHLCRRVFADHRAIEKLFDRVAATSDMRRRPLIGILLDAIDRHIHASLDVLYPTTRARFPSSRRIVDQRSAEAVTILGDVARLRRHMADCTSPAFIEAIEQLQQRFDRHLWREEDSLLPRLERSLDGNDMRQLGRSFDDAAGTPIDVVDLPGVAMGARARTGRMEAFRRLGDALRRS